MSPPSEPDVTEDQLLGGRIRFYQPRRGYRVAIDPVFLAAATPAVAGERILDAGAGSGAAALCLAWRVPGAVLVGLERDPELLDFARRNAAANQEIAPMTVVAGDLLSAADLGAGFDHVLTNPPFVDRRAATSPQTRTGVAAHMAEVALDRWLAACLARLRPRGRLTLIHRADALTGVLSALARAAGDVVVFPLWPTEAAPAARRVIVAARKGAKGPSRLAKGLVLHGPGGGYSEAAQAVLRDAQPLPL